MNLEELVLKAKNGDNEALVEIINRFKGFIYKTSKEIYINGYDTEDLLQIGYMSLINAVFKFDLNKNKNFTSYVSSAIKNNFYYEIRQKSRYNAESSLNKELDEGIEFIENLVSDENLEEKVLLKEDIYSLYKALKLLSPEERELINYVYFKHGKLKEYSKIKNMNYVTCIKFKEKILKKLKKLME